MPIYRLPVVTSSLPLRKYSSSSSSGSSQEGGRQHPQQHYNNQHPSHPKHHMQQQQQQYLDPNENIVKRSHSIPIQMTAVNHYTSAPERVSTHPSNESIVEREIRLQLEREAEIAQLHGRGSVSQGGAPNHSHGDFAAAEVATHSLEIHHAEPRPIVKSFPADIEDGRKAIRQYSRVGESLIVREMLEQRRREEELRNHWRKLEALKAEDMMAARDSRSSFVGDHRTPRPGSGENVSPPAGNIRAILRVQPFEDSDEESDSKQTFITPRMETVMEREIRLQRQREGSFRRARGYPLQSKDDRLEEVEIYPPPAMRLGQPGDQRGLQQSGLDRRASDGDASSDEMSVQRFATNRLKQEMFRERQRELDLRRQGKIYSISEEERVGLDPEPSPSNQSLFDDDSMLAGASASRTDSLATLKEPEYLQQHQPQPNPDRYVVSDNGRRTSQPAVIDEHRPVVIPSWRIAAELRIEEEVKEARRREKELREQRRLANDALIHQMEQQHQQNLSSQLHSRQLYRRT